MQTGTAAAPLTMRRVPIPPPAPTDTAEKRLTQQDRAPHTPINTATLRPIPKGQGPRLAKTPMVALRLTLPGREHRRQTPTAATLTMPKGQGLRPQPMLMADPPITIPASAQFEPLPRGQLHTPASPTMAE